ncbi:MAG: type IV pilus secretin PilQ [Gammaproteobacteria bacterium]|nr:type IV pilus secretin PilQ [Gammaproteobacteria bacterium]
MLGQVIWIGVAQASASLDDITFTAKTGDEVDITLHMSGDVPKPGSFTIDNPARLALDLPGTTDNLRVKNINVGVGVARNISAVEAGGRTRVVVDLTRLVPYSTRTVGNNIIVTIGGTAATASAPSTQAGFQAEGAAGNTVQDVTFRRGENGEGRVVITVSNPNTAMDMQRRGDQVIVTLQDVKLPEKLERRLDVMDFGTPVRTVDTFTHGNDVRVVMTGGGEFEHLGYQTDNHITLEVKKYVKPKEELAKKKQEYTGERLSLNFQNIEVRAVLQLIADFTGINMVTSDSVTGNVTLRLKNVPWDQALDIILKTKGLDKRQKGNVMLIAPAAELAAQEKLELESQKQVTELAPITSETIQVNYAKASDIAKILKAKGNSLISERGNVTVDERTNKLLVQDTAKNIDAIAALVEELDVPVKQVLIESRVVLVTTNYSRELGVKFGVSSQGSSGSTSVGTSGSVSGAEGAIDSTGSTTLSGVSPRSLNVSLPATGAAGSIALAVAKLPFGTIVDLELSAAEAEGQTEIVSSPKVITSNQHKAKILQGQEIPYLQSSSSGAATIAFKEAVLKLEVTPQITPDDRINLDLLVTKDSPDYANAIVIPGVGASAPPINKQEVDTNILVDNGETIVLGGVYEQTKSNKVTRVPFFGDLPLVGFLFRNTSKSDDKSELLIFVTPKIVKQDVTL